MDRRVKYTKMTLNDSFLKFLQTKPLEKITVTEICKDADINRSTYYAHFSDPFDQFAKLKAELFGDLASYTEEIETGKLPENHKRYKILKSLLQYIDKKRIVFRTLLATSGDYNVQHELLSFFGEKAFGSALDRDSDMDEKKRHYYLIYASNGCFGMFYEWLMDDHAIDSDQLARLMADFTRNVIK